MRSDYFIKSVLYNKRSHQRPHSYKLKRSNETNGKTFENVKNYKWEKVPDGSVSFNTDL